MESALTGDDGANIVSTSRPTLDESSYGQHAKSPENSQASVSSSSSSSLNQALGDHISTSNTTAASGSGFEFNYSDTVACTGGSEYSSSNSVVNPDPTNSSTNTSLESASQQLLSSLTLTEPPVVEGGLTASHSKVTPTDIFSQDQDCAICLDKIQPKEHAKATLACRHEFHLSCISMAFAMGKDMVCPLCRYLHKNQPFMNLESDSDVKPVSGQSIAVTANRQQRSFQSRHPFSRSLSTPLHEHPTSGTVLSMMPSLFETTLGHGPTAGTIRTSPGGICLKTSTWILLYVMPFTVSICFLAFVLGKVETLWSKISCLIGAAICYMVCWAIVVAIMDPDHEARDLLERLDQLQNELSLETRSISSPSANGSNIIGTQEISGLDGTTPTTINPNSVVNSSSTQQSSPLSESLPTFWIAWTQNRYVQLVQNRVMDLSRTLDDLPGDWW
ncbi:hypothetical protein BGZ46_001094 [Entomortierella lignicola]|nr:hypothetical protein BGZ46_001094 [Entomortierella lignicola]